MQAILNIDDLPDGVSKKEKVLLLGRSISRYLFRALLLIALLVTAWFLFSRMPVNYTDWLHTFRPAALNWQNPYHREAMVFNPPWIFPVLYPLAVLPHPAGASLLIIISVIAVAMYVGSLKKTLIVAASAPMAAFFALGQLDALLLFGLMLPRGLGLPILLAKPQGVFLAILPRLNRWSILVTLLIFVVSVFIWGQWWWNIIAYQPNKQANMSLFPYTIVLGIPLTYLGLKRKSDALLCAASLCFAPYFMAQSMLPMVAAIVRETEDWRWWGGIVLGSWVYEAAMKGFLW
ncbi:MAG: hypothetical protein JW953_04040 [Anaerolineae bacterium]|nr:hypothetical protein [Anaerolineae bacterium]